MKGAYEMNLYIKTIAGISALSLTAASLFSCSMSKKDDGSEEISSAHVTEAEGKNETETEEEFRKADTNEEMAITWLSDYDLNPARHEKRSSALEIFEDVFGGKINYIHTSSDSKYDKLAEMIDAGEEVDMFPYDPGAFPEGMTRDLYAPLDPYYEELGMDTGIWDDMQEVIDMYEYNGGHYVIPFSFSDPIVLTYSRNIIRQEGFSDPYELYKQGSWNWDTFMEMMQDFKDNASDGTARYGISGELGRAALASSGHTIIKKENGKYINNISDPEIAKAEQMVIDIGQQGLYRDNWLEHFDTDGNILFYAMGTWALGSSNALNDDKDLMVVPFPKSPDSDRYYISCHHNAMLLVSSSKKGKAVAAYIRCERLAETEQTFADDKKKLATAPVNTAKGEVKSVITSEQYDAIQEYLSPAKVFPIFDPGYGMGDNMYNANGSGVMYSIDRNLTNGHYASWESAREAWDGMVSEEAARFAD